MYFHYYKKQLNNNQLSRINNNNNISLYDLENFAKTISLNLVCYDVTLTNFKNLKIQTPFSIILKNYMNLNHCYIVLFKNNKGIKIHDFNGNIRFVEYNDLKNIFINTIFEITPKNKYFFKNIKINGIFSDIDIMKLLLTNYKLVISIFLSIISFVFISIVSCLFPYFLFKINNTNYEAIFLIALFFFLSLFFKFIF